MDLYFKLTGAVCICALLCVMLKRHAADVSMVLSVLCCTGIFICALGFLSPILQLLKKLRELSGLTSSAFSPLLKTVAIGYLTQLTGAFCIDAGEQAMAKMVEICGTLLAIYCALPLAEMMIDLLQNLIGG